MKKQKKEKEMKEAKVNKKKRKRKVSIFTVFLWLFLITTMSTITIGSLTKKNAIEVTDNNWNIQLVMYDRSSDTPDQAIKDFTWNAIKETESKQLAMQINYACTTGKEYQPGEIVIEIPGIGKDSFSEFYRSVTDTPTYLYSYSRWLRDNVAIAADEENSVDKQYDWSYHYDKENNLYTFTNNIAIAENENFEGTIQIVYNLLPRFRIETNLEYQAKIRENIQSDEIIVMESNICSFHYIGTKKTYKIWKFAYSAPRKDFTPIEDILDDYYWVQYVFNSNSQLMDYNKEGTISALSIDGGWVKETLPEGCIMYDKDLNKVEPIEDNTYYYLKLNYRTDNWYDNSSHLYYVGYPKSKYQEGESVTNIAELWGRYEDEEEIQKLDETSATVSLVEYDFEYKGDLYTINKASDSQQEIMYSNKIKNGGNIAEWGIIPRAFYTGSLMDVEIGDDLLYITRENGEVTKLEDNEYYFTKIMIPIFYTYNKFDGSQGDKLVGYEWELQVRYKDTTEYVTYKTGISSEGETFKRQEGSTTYYYTLNDYIEFENNNVVGIKVIVKDLDKTLYVADTRNISQYSIRVYTNLQTQNCMGEGKVYNFDYIQVYHKDEEENRTLANKTTLDSYKTPSTLNIAEYDQVTYGDYMQRNYATYDMVAGRLNLENRKMEEYSY